MILVSQVLTKPLFTSGAQLIATMRVDNLEANEKMIVRVDTRLVCKAGSRPTGNLQGALDRATSRHEDGTNYTIQAGQQTIPFQQIGQLIGNGAPLIEVIKKVVVGTDCSRATSSVVVSPGDTITYCYTVRNRGTETLFSVTLIDDNATPSISTDNVNLSLRNTTTNQLVTTIPGQENATSTYQRTAFCSGGNYTNIAVGTGRASTTSNQWQTASATASVNVTCADKPNLQNRSSGLCRGDCSSVRILLFVNALHFLPLTFLSLTHSLVFSIQCGDKRIDDGQGGTQNFNETCEDGKNRAGVSVVCRADCSYVRKLSRC